MGVKVNEIKTLFTLDARNFDKAVQNAEKSVQNIKDEFSATQKQVDQLKKALGQIDKFEMDVDSDEITKAISEITKLEKGLEKASESADEMLDGLSEGIDLRTFDKLEKMLKNMSDIDIVDLSSIQKAERQIDKMLSSLKQQVQIDAKLDIDDTQLRGLESQIDVLVNAKGAINGSNGGLRHWIDNNGSGMNQAADDTHKVLQDILSAVKGVINKTSPDKNTKNQKVEVDTKPIAKLNGEFGKVASSINETNDAINRMADSTTEAWKQTDTYAEHTKALQDVFRKAKEMQDDLLGSGDLLNGGLEDFGEVNQEIDKIVNSVKDIFNETERVINGMDSYEDKLSRIKADYDQVTKENDTWNQSLERTQEEVLRIQKELEDITNARLDMNEAFDVTTGRSNREQELRRELTMLTAQQNVQERITQELRQQAVRSQECFNEQRDLYSQSRLQNVEDERRTDELKRQEKEIEDQQQEAKKLSSIFSSLSRVLSALGFGKFASSIEGIAGNAGNAKEGLKGLADAFKATKAASAATAEGTAAASSSMAGLGAAAAAAGPVLAAVAVALVAIAAPIAGVVLGFKTLKKVMDETVPQFTEMEKAITKVAAAMRLSGEAYYEFAEQFKNGFMDQGYTKDANEYADALMRVKQQLEGLAQFDYSSAEAATEDVLTLSSLTGYDPNEIVRSARNMAINFGTEISSVLDMMMRAYQKTGDPMNDLLDTMQEYPSQFKKMGVSAEFFYDLITRGSEAGVYNTDKIADTFKELYLRISEGADDSSAELLELGYSVEDIARAANATDDVIAAFDKLGISANNFKTEIAAGGSRSEGAIYGLVDAIAAVEDKAAQQEIIADLFGAPGEDVGSHFFEVLSEGEVAIGEFGGAISEAGQLMEGTLGYQVDELKNKFTTLRAEIGENFGVVFKEAITDINNNFGLVQESIQSNLIPALEMLGFAIIDPFVDGKTSAIDFVLAVIEGISSFIEGFAIFINVCNGIIAILRVVSNGIEIVWNLCQILVESLATLALGIIQMIGNVITVVIDGVYNLVTDFDTSCKNMGIAWSNFCTGIHNTFGVAVADIQKLAAGMINGIIEGLNVIPGIDISYRAKWGSNYTQKGYKDYLPYEKGLNLTDKFNDYMGNEFDFMANRLGGNVADLFKDIEDMGDAFGDFGKTFTFTSRFDEMKAKLEGIKKEQKEVDKKQQQINTIKAPTNDTILGNNVKQEDLITKAKEEQAAVDKKKNELKEKETDLQKELNDLIKQEQELQKEIFEEMKRQINLEKDYAADRRSWEEAIYDQQKKLITDKEDALLFEMATIEDIRQKYVLTAEQQISYQQKQFDLAISLRDYYLDRYKDSIQKEIDAVKNRAKEELKIEKNKNDKLIKDKERQIKAIEALMRENDYSNEQDDLDYEIKQTEEELQKYLYATSFDGISKRQELEEQLRTLRLEKERAAKNKELEDKKQALQDEIDDIKEADEEAEKAAEEKAEAMEKIYDDMFTELEEVLNSGMFDIGKIQELAQQETNSTVKNLLNEMVLDYQNALKLVEKYSLNMKDILAWNTGDAIGDIVEGTLTGDSDKVNDGKDTIDKDQNWQSGQGSNASESAFKQAQDKYNRLKKEYTTLGSKKVKTAADKARMKTIEAEVAGLRKIWGFSGYQDTSAFKTTTSAQQAVASSISGLQNQVSGLSKTKLIEAPTYDIPNYTLPSYDNSINPQALRLDSSLSTAAAANHTEVTNNNGPLMAIGTFNNNSNADVRKLAYEMNANLNIKNRSKGKRN